MEAPSEASAVLAARLTDAVTLMNVCLRSVVSARRLSVAKASALATLRDRGPMTPTRLAKVVGVAQPTMSGLVGRMERAGWIRRSLASADRRCHEVSISPAGERLIDEIRDARRQRVEEHLRRLPGSEVESLQAAAQPLEHLARSLETRG